MKKNKLSNININEMSVNSSIDSKERQKKFLRITICCGIVFILSATIFSPSLNNGFINWDDEHYVVNNSHIKGLTLRNIVKVFSTIYVSNYQPLTMLSYMLDYHFFKLNPMGYHATNLLIHIANSLLVFILIYSLTGKILTSLLGALLFAIHPLRVGSVAWVAERKDVLSAFFLLSFNISLYTALKAVKSEMVLSWHRFLCVLFVMQAYGGKPAFYFASCAVFIERKT